MRIFKEAAVVSVFVGSIVISQSAFASDKLSRKPAATASVAADAVYNWSGFYAGVNAGAAFGSYDPHTSIIPGGKDGPLTVALVQTIGQQVLNPKGFTGGEQIGYNWQTGRYVYGVEADFNYLHLNGATSTGAVVYPGNAANQFVIGPYAHNNWMLTLRPRAGLAVNNWLFYATAGLAITDIKGQMLFTDTLGGLQTASINDVKLGYTAGAGVEWGVSDRLSMKAEYLYAGFDRINAAQNTSNFHSSYVQSEALTANIVRLGLNYRFGDGNPLSSYAAMPVKAPAMTASTIDPSNWELEAGSRVWFSTGRIGAPQPLFNPLAGQLISRLIFNNLEGIAGETFVRLDHSSGWFVKGVLGAGGVNSGSMNDEDFPAAGAYSNTLSSASGHIGYGTIDTGYSFLRTTTAKVGAFVGYNYYEEDINTYGCQQLAGANTCVTAFPSSFLGIAQDGHYNAVRVGLSSQFMLTDRLKLTADAAYLPWVNFTGQDDHNARLLQLPQAASSGDGVMLEAILGYNVTQAWNVGVGGRYWAYNTRTGSTAFNFLTAPAVNIVEPARYNSERYGFFLQSSYKWGGVTPVAASMPIKAPEAPMNWTGIYLGGHLGGGVSGDRWADPFLSGPSGLGFTDVAGFGDTTHATGPLGGAQIGANWQAGRWVLGLQADISGTDMRGENTCFSGAGGVNCQHVVNAFGTVTGRVGYAWDRSLVYAKAGGALVNSTYNILANTNLITFGSGSVNQTAGGWVVGTGFEYALTDNWTTLFEYDHIGVGSTAISFPTVAVLGIPNGGVRQSIDLFRLGVNYKFAWAGTGLAGVR